MNPINLSIKTHGQETGPVYESPRITTFTSEELLERLGPAQTCSPAPV
ncbi:MAG: hypothetical protein MUC98_15330 [Desulfobacterota bacterium]|nr:hypothetical protein [Thermodesulfobacteriota bacterium]